MVSLPLSSSLSLSLPSARRPPFGAWSASSVPGKFRWLSVLFCRKPVLSSESEPVLSSKSAWLCILS